MTRARPARVARSWPWALGAVLAAAIVYFPVVRTYWLADDLRNFLVIADRGPVSFIFEQFASHALVVRNTIWVIFYRLFGLTSGPYMWSALLTHLLNVWLLWRLLDRLTDRPALAALAVAWWGVSPLHVGTVGLYSVYAHELVGTFMLCVLLLASRTAMRGEPVRPAAAIGWLLLLALGANSFGTGLGAAIVVPVALLVCLPLTATRSLAVRLILLSGPLWAALDYLGMRVIGQRVSPSVDSLAIVQASWHQLPVLVSDVRLFAELFSFGFGGLLLGHLLPARESARLVLSGVACFGALTVVGITMARADRDTRRWMIGLVGIAAGIYGIIALGRAAWLPAFGLSTEAAALPLRYHYAATIPFTVAFVVSLAAVLRSGRVGPWARVAFVLAVGLQVAGWWLSGFTIPANRETVAFMTVAQRQIAAFAAAAPPGADVMIGNVPAPPGVLRAVSPAGFPGWAGVFVIGSPDDLVAGHRVFFVEDSPAVRNAHVAPASRRLSRLLVRPPLRLGDSCELGTAMDAVRLGRGILACPTSDAASGDSCVARVRGEAAAHARRCQCADPRALDKRVSDVATALRAALTCPGAAQGFGDACRRHVLRRLGVLVASVSACDRDAVASGRGLDDWSCADRAAARYVAQIDRLGGDCTACFDVRLLANPARDWVRDVIGDTLCGMPRSSVRYGPVVDHDGAAPVPGP